MSPQPGNVNKLTHAEVLSTHVQPATNETPETESPAFKPLIEALEASRLENELLRAANAALQSLADANACIPETKPPEGGTAAPISQGLSRSTDDQSAPPRAETRKEEAAREAAEQAEEDEEDKQPKS